VHASAEDYYGVKADWTIKMIKEKLKETDAGYERI
jgi:hypothetical protein